MWKFLFVLTTLMCVGCNSSNPYDENTISQAKETAESYIENNYKGVRSIELENPYQSPMGAMILDGTVNKDIDFSITLTEDYSVAGISKDKDFPKRKDECRENSCD